MAPTGTGSMRIDWIEMAYNASSDTGTGTARARMARRDGKERERERRGDTTIGGLLEGRGEVRARQVVQGGGGCCRIDGVKVRGQPEKGDGGVASA